MHAANSKRFKSEIVSMKNEESLSKREPLSVINNELMQYKEATRCYQISKQASAIVQEPQTRLKNVKLKILLIL